MTGFHVGANSRETIKINIQDGRATALGRQSRNDGAVVSAGSASVSSSGSAMTIAQSSQRAVINWQTFNIGADASVNVVQPSSSAVLLNRIGSDAPSQIFGRLSANGQVVLVSGRPADLRFNVVNQLSFRVESLDALRHYHNAVSVEADVTEIRPVTHGNAWSVYCRDPETNRLEFYMHTPWYISQPYREP